MLDGSIVHAVSQKGLDGTTSNPRPPAPVSPGLPDPPRHRPVLHGARLGAAVPVQLHPEDACGHGHVEPLLFLRVGLHLPVDLCSVSYTCFLTGTCLASPTPTSLVPLNVPSSQLPVF